MGEFFFVFGRDFNPMFPRCARSVRPPVVLIRPIHRMHTIPAGPLTVLNSKIVPSILVAFMVGSGAVYCSKVRAEAETKEPSSIFDFEAVKIDGTPQDLAEYRGKVCLVVNVASKWGKFYTEFHAWQLKQQKQKKQQQHGVQASFLSFAILPLWSPFANFCPSLPLYSNWRSRLIM